MSGFKNEIHKYTGLPGVKARFAEGPLKNTVSGILKALVSYRACAGAGDHGSVMVWRDDDSNYRCYFMRFHNPMTAEIFKTKKEVKKWLEVWLPKQSIAP